MKISKLPACILAMAAISACGSSSGTDGNYIASAGYYIAITGYEAGEFLRFSFGGRPETLQKTIVAISELSGAKKTPGTTLPELSGAKKTLGTTPPELSGAKKTLGTTPPELSDALKTLGTTPPEHSDALKSLQIRRKQ